MTMNIGLWIIPVLITVISLVVSYIRVPKPQHGHYFPDFTPIAVFGYNLIIALVISLLSWIVYAVFVGMN